MATRIQFLQKPSCTTCQKAKALLVTHNIEFTSRDLDKERLNVDELDKLIGKRDYKEFLNPRNELFRAQKMKQNPPSRAEALKLMAREPNLIRRPVLIKGKDVVLGFSEEMYRKLGIS